MAESADASPGANPSEKRADILAAAHALFMEQGYGSTAMDAVASRAGVSKRTIYSHFQSKDGLFEAMMDAACQRIGGAPALSTPPAGDVPSAPPEQALGQMGRWFLNILFSPEGMGVFRIVINEAHRFPDLAQAFHRAGPDSLRRALEAYFVSRNAVGDMAVDDPKDAAWTFMALLKSQEHLEVMLGIRAAPDQAGVGAITDRAVAKILRLYGAGG